VQVRLTRYKRAKVVPLRRGDVVALRSPAEILATLDDTGSLDGLPFMPEMLGHFGRPHVVSARVERACDTITQSGARQMPDTVILDDLRCDGGGHAGCQAACRIFWKEAWLRRVDPDAEVAQSTDSVEALRELAVANSHRTGGAERDAEVFRCQATDFLKATKPLEFWDLRSFGRELSSRNVSVWRFLRVIAHIIGNEPFRRLGRTRMPFKQVGGGVEIRSSNGLQPGSIVRVRQADEIAATLDANSRLRGLWFDREMLPYCGARATIKSKVSRFIDEESGAMVELASDCYILDGVVCEGYVSEGRWFCCRAIYPWWREAWLEPESK
jgi:hypothetical protein